MARKKIVFVIVEGPSDETALGVVLTKYFENDNVHIEIMHSDITVQKDTRPENIIKKIVEEVKKYANNYHFKPIHFKSIIHIVDTDGAFCSKDIIMEDTNLNQIMYFDDRIMAPNKEKVISRNEQKSKNLIKIYQTEKIWEIPYKVYYMSCNLEHVLFNKLNCNDKEKENLSYEFAKKYKNNLDSFLNFIRNSSFSVDNDYLLTWKFIQNENNSLKRYTNFSGCFTAKNESKNI